MGLLFMLTFRNKYDKINKKDLEILRKKCDLPELPLEYVNFMVKHNGGKSSYDTFSFNIGNENESTIISLFYSISTEPDDINSLNYAMSYYSRYPKDVMPIACDYLGNIVCLGIKSKIQNHVFIWIHDMVDEDDKWANLFLVSNSFNDFLNNLTQSGVNEPEEKNDLHEICKKGEYKKLEAELKKGVNKEELSGLARICAYFGYTDMLKLLYSYECPLKMVAYVAIKGKQTKTAIYLLDNYENINDILPDRSSWLHKAVEFNNVELVKFLIDKGCDVSVKDARGSKAIMRTQNPQIKKLLGGR